MEGSVAYVSQQAFLLNATLRDNILFGEEYEEERYSLVVQACALHSDFKELVAGDKTLIGDKGSPSFFLFYFSLSFLFLSFFSISLLLSLLSINFPIHFLSF